MIYSSLPCLKHTVTLVRLYGLNIHMAKKGVKKKIDYYIYFLYANGKVCQENNFHMFVCDSLDVSGGDINHVTFIFPLNLEHGSPPRRIQN